MIGVRTSKRRRILALALPLLVIVGLIAGVPQTRWRAHVVLLHVMGRIPDIELTQLIAYMMPGADQSITRLMETRNPHAVIRNFRTSDSDLQAGSTLFQDRCASCHGTDAAGGSRAPSLVGRDFDHGASDWAVYRTIHYGIPGTAMPPHGDLSDNQRWQIIAFLRFIDRGESGRAVPKIGSSIASDVSVPYPEMERTRYPDEDWLTFSGSYWSSRHSRLQQIRQDNVRHLNVAWIHQFSGSPTNKASPLVREGVMFVSSAPCAVHAIDARTGKTIWSWSCTLKSAIGGDGVGTSNRGLALLDDRVFVASWDARLFAISAKTGAQLWEATVAEDDETYYISQAPLAYRGLVVAGVSTRQVGRGYVSAFDAETGEQKWTFVSIPGPGEPGNETWSGDSWKRGGGPMWMTGSYDPEEDLLYWGVGNPKPDYDHDARAGDNLYTNSVVALRGTTGEIVWHFQFSPGDNHDWDSAQIPILIDDPVDGSIEKRLLWANRNGYYYVLNRLTGKFILGTPFVHQNWNLGLDEAGHPIRRPESSEIEGELIYPGNVGGTNWWPPTYDPQRNLMIVPILEQGMVFFPSVSSWPQASGRSFYTAIRAFDSSTGKLVWEHRNPDRFVNNHSAGTMSTDGGLVFGSNQGRFFALSADTGELLWSMETGADILAAPVTFEVDGRQFVSIVSGGDLLTFALSDTGSSRAAVSEKSSNGPSSSHPGRTR